MVTRKAWVYPPGAGDLGALSLREEAIEEPVLGELRIRVQAIGLNFADVFTGLALYGPIMSGQVGREAGGFVPGLEFAGIVECVGKEDRVPEPSRAHGSQLCELSEDAWRVAKEKAKRFKPGDRIMGVLRFGAYADRVNVPAHQVFPLPTGWSVAEGAAFAVQSLTVYYALKQLGAMQKGHTVLISSIAGGCGLQATAICLKLGVKVVGTVGSASKIQVVLDKFPSMKAEQIVVRGGSLEPKLRSALAAVDSPEGFDIVLDAVQGDTFQPGWDCLAAGGRYIVYGAASMTPQQDKLGILGWLRLAWQWLWRPKVDPLELPGVNKGILGFNLIHLFNKVEMLAGLIDEILALDLPAPRVGLKQPFEKAVEALRTFQSGQTTGKVVLEVAASE